MVEYKVKMDLPFLEHLACRYGKDKNIFCQKDRNFNYVGYVGIPVLGSGYDVKLIRCCPQYDVKLMWRHRGNDIMSFAAICAAAQLIFLFGRTRLAV